MEKLFVGYTLGMYFKPYTDIVDYVHFLNSSSIWLIRVYVVVDEIVQDVKASGYQ